MRTNLKSSQMPKIEIDLPEGATLEKRAPDHASLADLSPGQSAVVCCVRPDTAPRRRLMEMGFVSGTKLRLVRYAPFGDPIQVELHGYHLSLRRSEAREILVRPA